jgi:hypothetical protein
VCRATGCSAKLHFFPHTKEIQYVGEHNHPKAGGTGEEEEEEAVAPASPATATVVTVAACAAVIPPEVYQRPVRQSTRRQRSCTRASCCVVSCRVRLWCAVCAGG